MDISMDIPMDYLWTTYSLSNCHYDSTKHNRG